MPSGPHFSMSEEGFLLPGPEVTLLLWNTPTELTGQNSIHELAEPQD